MKEIEKAKIAERQQERELELHKDQERTKQRELEINQEKERQAKEREKELAWEQEREKEKKKELEREKERLEWGKEREKLIKEVEDRNGKVTSYHPLLSADIRLLRSLGRSNHDFPMNCKYRKKRLNSLKTFKLFKNRLMTWPRPRMRFRKKGTC
jgi:hypothetical protein